MDEGLGSTPAGILLAFLSLKYGKKTMTEDFTITITSDGEHENVFAEIYCGGKFVALVSQEEEMNKFRIEFPLPGVDEALIVRAVDMESFRQALVAATEKLTGKT